MTVKLSHRERHFLSLLVPDGATIGVGLSVGASLRHKGLVTVAKYGRYGITEAGKAALAGLAYAVNEPGRTNAPARQTPLQSRPKGLGNRGRKPAGTRPGNPGQTDPGQGQLPLI
jgi:hypothetical protein